MISEIVMILFGLSMGSFGNNLVSGFVFNKKIDLKLSFCSCGERKLRLYEIIPLFSFMFSKGKCRECSTDLSFRYFGLEFFTAVLALLCLIKYDFTIQCLLWFLAYYIMMLIAVVDFYKLIIPNVLLIFLSLITILLLFNNTTNISSDFLISISLITLFLFVNFFYKKYKSVQGIGFGDIKYIAVLSLLFTFPYSLIGLWISAVIALPLTYVIRHISTLYKSEIKIPFGAFLSLGYIITGLLDSQLIQIYTYIFMAQ